MNRILQAVFVLLLALLMVFSLPYGSPVRAYDHEEKSTATAQGGQAAKADYKNITSGGVSSAGAGAATGLKEAAFTAIIVGVVVAGALLAASISSDAGPIPTTSHHP